MKANITSNLAESFKEYSIHNSFHNTLIAQSVNSLELSRKNRVLEVGHGVCDYLPYIMQQAENLKYFGMEISNQISREAATLNQVYVNDNKALFQVYDGETIPYVHNIFDRILSVNTIYYWKNAVTYLDEIFRCLRPGGVCVVSFSDSLFLEQLPVLHDKNIYNFYNKETITANIEASSFSLFNIQEHKRRIKSSNGLWEEESYFIAVLRKKEKSRYLR